MLQNPVARISPAVLLRILFIAAAVCFLLSAAAFPAAAADEKVVKVGYFELEPILTGAEDGAVKSGFVYEYMQALVPYTGWTYEYVYGDFATLLDKVASGEIDLLSDAAITEERMSMMLFPDNPLGEEEYYIYKQEGNTAIDAYNLSTLNGKKIGVITGFSQNSILTDWCRENRINLQQIEVTTAPQLYEGLKKGDFDLVYDLNYVSGENVVPVQKIGSNYYYFVINKNRPDILRELNEAETKLNDADPFLKSRLEERYIYSSTVASILRPEEQEWIASHDKIRVGGFSNDAPDIYIDEKTGEIHGLTPDLIHLILERLNIEKELEVEITLFDTLDEMYQAIDAGEIDVFYPYYARYSLAEQQGLIISDTVQSASMSLVYPKTISISEAMNKIATPGTRLGVYFVQEHFPDAELCAVNSIPQAVEAVREGKASSAIAHSTPLYTAAKKYTDLASMSLGTGCDVCFAADISNRVLIMLLNHGITHITSAEIDKMIADNTPEEEYSVVEFVSDHQEIVVLVTVAVILFIIVVVGLIIIIILRQRTEKSAKAARLAHAEAEKANKSKSVFLFNMSHDIRTPMNAILGFTNRAIKNRNDAAVVDDSLLKVRESGEYLLTLINDILDMSKIEAGKMVLTEKPNCILASNEAFNAMFASDIAARNHVFHNDVTDVQNPYVWSDDLHVRQIITNLLSNAIKYTPEGGEIWHSARQIPCPKEGYGRYVLTVRDNGIGMSEEFVQRIFEAFEREHSSTEAKTQGTGLGMSIVKRLVDLMHGTIDITSKQNEGTQVSITLDLRLATKEEYEARMAEEFPQTASEDIELKGRRILLVDDNEMNLEIAEDILNDAEFIVETADDGKTAVAMLQEKGASYYDCILMDIQMPEMNGYEATREIRRMYPDTHIPIIALSANAFEEDRAASLAAGMDEHQSKPIEVHSLMAAMRRVILK